MKKDSKGMVLKFQMGGIYISDHAYLTMQIASNLPKKKKRTGNGDLIQG